MGNRRFREQLCDDEHIHQQHGITDEVDVTTTKDYMQAREGGREGRGRGGKGQLSQFYSQFLA